MSPPPPTSTLFPYTTLFRSLHDGADRNIDNGTFETKPGRQYGDKKPGVKGISKNLEKAVECYQTGPVFRTAFRQIIPYQYHGNTSRQTDENDPDHIFRMILEKNNGQKEHQNGSDDPVEKKRNAEQFGVFKNLG